MQVALQDEWGHNWISDRATETDGFVATTDHYEAARILKERALEDPSGWINSHLRLIGAVFRAIFYKDKWASYMKRHVALSGENEVRFILTYRTHMKPAWHLSFLPCRYGELRPGEWEEIKDAFEIPEGAKIEHDGSTTHVYWG